MATPRQVMAWNRRSEGFCELANAGSRHRSRRTSHVAASKRAQHCPEVSGADCEVGDELDVSIVNLSPVCNTSTSKRIITADNATSSNGSQIALPHSPSVLARSRRTVSMCQTVSMHTFAKEAASSSLSVAFCDVTRKYVHHWNHSPSSHTRSKFLGSSFLNAHSTSRTYGTARVRKSPAVVALSVNIEKSSQTVAGLEQKVMLCQSHGSDSIVNDGEPSSQDSPHRGQCSLEAKHSEEVLLNSPANILQNLQAKASNTGAYFNCNGSEKTGSHLTGIEAMSIGKNAASVDEVFMPGENATAILPTTHSSLHRLEALNPAILFLSPDAAPDDEECPFSISKHAANGKTIDVDNHDPEGSKYLTKGSSDFNIAPLTSCIIGNVEVSAMPEIHGRARYSTTSAFPCPPDAIDEYSTPASRDSPQMSAHVDQDNNMILLEDSIAVLTTPKAPDVACVVPHVATFFNDTWSVSCELSPSCGFSIDDCQSVKLQPPRSPTSHRSTSLQNSAIDKMPRKLVNGGLAQRLMKVVAREKANRAICEHFVTRANDCHIDGHQRALFLVEDGTDDVSTPAIVCTVLQDDTGTLAEGERVSIVHSDFAASSSRPPCGAAIELFSPWKTFASGSITILLSASHYRLNDGLLFGNDSENGRRKEICVGTKLRVFKCSFRKAQAHLSLADYRAAVAYEGPFSNF